MKLSDINVSTLFINKYTRNLDYKNNYEKSPIPYHSLAIMLIRRISAKKLSFLRFG